MTLYRVSYYVEGGTSAGFSFHATRDEARAAVKESEGKDPEEYTRYALKKGDERIETITVTPTNAGILVALSKYASHADNG